MTQAGDDAGFTLEALARFRCHGMTRENFHGHVSTQTCVSGAIDLSHASRADLRGDAVRPQHCSGVESHTWGEIVALLCAACAKATRCALSASIELWRKSSKSRQPTSFPRNSPSLICNR